jgi:hypothetical protein
MLSMYAGLLVLLAFRLDGFASECPEVDLVLERLRGFEIVLLGLMVVFRVCATFALLLGDLPGDPSCEA